MALPLLVTFVAGTHGNWKVTASAAVTGPGLETAPRLAVVEDRSPVPQGMWSLRGVTSNERYVERHERHALTAVQAPLGRPDATAAALIPIRKSSAWWDLTQDERRAILEDRSHHIDIGLRYLPEIARRLHHSRDLGEPFDFLTWFEYDPRDTNAFDELLGLLRETEEWSYVDREVELRLTRMDAPQA